MPTTTQNIYGVDLPSLPDLDPNMREISGTEVLAQDLIKRISTALLFYAPGKTIDVRSYLSKGITDQQLYTVKDVVEQTILLDERVQACTCAPTTDGVSALTLAIQVTPNAGPAFQMIASVTSVNVALIGLN